MSFLVFVAILTLFIIVTSCVGWLFSWFLLAVFSINFAWWKSALCIVVLSWIGRIFNGK